MLSSILGSEKLTSAPQNCPGQVKYKKTNKLSQTRGDSGDMTVAYNVMPWLHPGMRNKGTTGPSG